MTQDISTAKKKDNFCGICRYCLYDEEENGFICHNENSVMYGEYLSDIGHEDCNKYEGEKYSTMSLKEALTIMTEAQMYQYSAKPRTNEFDPFIAIQFKTNEQLADYRDAHTRLFRELMEVRKKDGDGGFRIIEKDAQGLPMLGKKDTLEFLRSLPVDDTETMSRALRQIEQTFNV